MIIHAGNAVGAAWMQWNWQPFTTAALAAVGVAYARGARRCEPARVRAASFWSGWALLVFALLSPLHALSEQYFSAHMTQHTILMALAAPLIVLGRPGTTMLWAFSPERRRSLAHNAAIVQLRNFADVSPFGAFALHAVAIWLWHLPVLYDAAVRSDIVHVVQHASFFGTAVLFWSSLLSPSARAVRLGKGVVYVFATAAHTSILGAFLALSPVLWYAVYNVTHAQLSPLEDQQLAGFIMWIPAGVFYVIAALGMLSAWLQRAERRNAVTQVARALLMFAVMSVTACDQFQSQRKMNEIAAATLTGGNPRVGKSAVEQIGCGGCHTIHGVRGAEGKVGPPLDGIASRMYIAGVLPNTPDNMARWIVDPKAVDSLTAMPKLGVTPAQARDIAAFLYTLR